MARRRRSSASRTRRPRRRHGRRRGKGFGSLAKALGSKLMQGAKFAWKHRDKISKGVQVGREIGIPDKYLKYGDIASKLADAVPKGSTRR